MKTAGVIGWPLEFTLSPVMQQAAFDAAGLNVRFDKMPTPQGEVATRVQSLRAADCLGACVTTPHKQAVMPHLDAVSAEAEQIGSVNWIINADGKLTGHNTDGAGFQRALQHEFDFDIDGKSVLLFGAGGAARAVIYTLQKYGAKNICIVNRTAERAQQLADEFAKYGSQISCFGSLAEAYGAKGQFALLVNASNADWDSVAGAQMLQLGAVEMLTESPPCVYDLMYSSPRTRFMEKFSKHGCRTANGLAMLVYQGALGFRLMTGLSAPVDLMFREVQNA